ncbi:hypothetical protein [Comamonas thiooxydans]|uniref:hypothetical protein n=1 Tax=Comamonas thiooxydans TaxID=363952 RepID=UPI00057B2674|nr:hypothetical protein [Comamonas thiooxydans]
MRRLPLLSAALAAAVLLAGCGAAPPARVEIQQVKIAVPVPCDEREPERPNMATEHLAGDADVDSYVQAAAAEIERREGYEIQLRGALANCKRPLQASAQK